MRVWLVLFLSLSVASLAIWRLEAVRAGIETADLTIEDTPATRYAQPGAEGPLIVIAHGFAGSRQMMQAYALTLARAGYVAYAFDFEGHGQNPVPMSGDVSEISGTTQLLIDQTLDVLDDAIFREAYGGQVGLLGHSMATDILIRASYQDVRIGPLVLLSAFSQAVDAQAPPDMLMIAGQWEPGLRAFAQRAVQMVDAGGQAGFPVQSDDVRRMSLVAPAVEHVGILHSRAGRDAALSWFNTSFDRSPGRPARVTGPWLMALLAALVALAYPASRLLPKRDTPALAALSPPAFWTAALLPALAAPLIAIWVPVQALPVLVADYLALHLLIFGAVQLGLLWRFGVRPGGLALPVVLAFLIWGLVVFGGALHRYGANFLPTSERLVIIALLATGAILFMTGEALLTRGGQERFLRRLGARAAFLLSLGIAVALDPSELFFLAMIAPVIVLFYIVFGLMGRWVAQRAGALSAGLAQGLILAWALGVSFPLFAATGGAS